MNAVEKRNLFVKEVLKPMLKAAGFKVNKLNWWKELEDGYLFISMQNSRLNSETLGCCFWFHFSASHKDDIRDTIEKQWIYNQADDIREDAFLPHLGYLSPNRTSRGYQIDGYKNHQPIDTPIEEVFAQIKNDFEIHIMPQIMHIQSVTEFYKLKEMLKKNYDAKENLLLRYYSIMHSLCCSDSNLSHAMQIQKDFALTAEEIRAHYDWLETIAQNSSFPDLDATAFIEKALAI